MRRPDQNRHRLADGWQGSTVRSILENPRYTGFAFFGRWTRHETLLDPDDVAAGHVVRPRRADKETVVRSRQPAHPEIVSVETFTEVQLLRRTKAAGGLGTARQAERGGRAITKSPYLLRGMVRCGVCGRKMQGATIRKGVYYRCIARTLAPGSLALADHPKTVNLREDQLIEPLNGWIGRLFDREHIDQKWLNSLAPREMTEPRSTRPRRSASRTRRRRSVDPATSRTSPEYPFWHLGSSRLLWEVHGVPDVPRAADRTAAAGLTRQAAVLLRDEAVRSKVIDLVVNRYLSGDLRGPLRARDVLRPLVGVQIRTVSGQPNMVLAMNSDTVTVRTKQSPEG
jgi:hypothetical protein